MSYKVTHHKNGNTTIRVIKDKTKKSKYTQPVVTTAFKTNTPKLIHNIQINESTVTQEDGSCVRVVYASDIYTGAPLMKDYPQAQKACEKNPNIPYEIPNVPAIGNLDILFKQKLITRDVYDNYKRCGFK